MKSLAASGLFCSVLLLGFPRPAEALYLDPTTGSMVLQVMVGGLLAVVATTRLYWTRLRSLFRRGEDADAPRQPQ
jgi:hypothetical protein